MNPSNYSDDSDNESFDSSLEENNYNNDKQFHY